jgi:cellulose synthase/poly-beta-1,6-N-acetylglucosamine synthase-like glycosyltransferase
MPTDTPRHRLQRPVPRPAQRKHAAVTAVVIAALAITTFVVHLQSDDPLLIGYWWLGALIIAGCLVAFVKGKRYVHLPMAPGKILAIVPAYNEDSAALNACVWSLINQDRPPDKIVVIDDGSAVPVVGFDHPLVDWRQHGNTGKRGAQVAVLRTFEPDEFQYILTVDSDSAPYPDALQHLMRAMSNPKVQAATGMIYIRNYTDSMIARAADIDIGTSCVMMRASRSMLGALETTSGALAIYRSEILYDHLDAYAVECGTGDDRWLALRALDRGEVVAVAEAGVETDMPATYKGTYRQRLRWARSWWWMLPYAFSRLTLKQIISPTFGLMQLVITPLMTSWILILTILSFGHRYGSNPVAVFVYLGAYLVVRYGCSALYLIDRDMPLKQKLISWVVGTPAAVILNIFLLIPTRYWALFKLRDNRWQTRTVSPASSSKPAALMDASFDRLTTVPLSS